MQVVVLAARLSALGTGATFIDKLWRMMPMFLILGFGVLERLW